MTIDRAVDELTLLRHELNLAVVQRTTGAWSATDETLYDEMAAREHTLLHRPAA